MNPTPISTENLQQEFEHLLEDTTNRRIILSGIFGIGKTTFIRDFFEKRKNEFVAIKLFPVNYSVASNEDIFELIKYDIFYELLDKNPNYQHLDVTWYETLPFLTNDDIKEILGDFVALIPKFGKTINEVRGALIKTAKVFNRKKANLEQNDLAEIMDYAKLFETNAGGIYENDFYTNLIESLIDSLKPIETSKKAKQVVLVIDDLDRIDPEHIFRILNVFAAHFDRDSNKNKFNIDKVVLCCDIENVRQIFHTKYGSRVDFNGYIDKFFTKGIFHFKNKENVINAIPAILSSITSLESNFLFASNYYLKKLLIVILNNWMNIGCLNLRMLMKFAYSKYDSIERKIIANANHSYSIKNFRILLLFEFLVDLVGSEETVLSYLEQTTINFELKQREEKQIFGDLVYMAGWNGKVYDQYTGSDQRNFEVEHLKFYYTVIAEEMPDHKLIFSAVYTSLEGTMVDIVPSKIQSQVLVGAFKTYLIIKSR